MLSYHLFHLECSMGGIKALRPHLRFSVLNSYSFCIYYYIKPEIQAQHHLLFVKMLP